MRKAVLLGWVVLAWAGVAAGQVPAPPAAERFRPGGPAGWLVDDKTGCWVWVGGIDLAAERLRASWDGPCPDGPALGRGRALVEWRELGRDRAMDYRGDVVRGKNDGTGRLEHLENGQPLVIEDGEFRDDRFVRGRFEAPRAGLVYEGGWLFGQPHGQGRARIGGQTFEGVWERGCLPVGGGWVAVTRPVQECGGTPT